MALVFGMQHLLVDLYQVCSYDAPETIKCRALIFGMKHLLVDLYQDCSYDAPGVRTGLAPGVTILKHRNKDGKLQNSSFLKLEGAEL